MKYKINLLSRKKESLTDKLIYFALSYLRYILIITQIIVIGVFFYKFKVDQEIVDYQDSVGQKKEIIEVTQPLFVEAKTTDFQIKEIRRIIGRQDNFLDILNYLSTIFPDKLYLSKLTITDNSMKLEGFGDSGLLIQSFYQRLKTDKKFANINLKSLKKIDVGLSFEIELSKLN
jgi:hypothetical protein